MEYVYNYINKGNRILILGAYGYGNLGTEAILSGILEKISKEPTVVSANPNSTRQIHGVRAISKAELPIEIIKSDTIVIGGDELINDYYFRAQEFSNYLWRLKKPLEGKSIFGTALLSRLLRKRLVFLGLGVGKTGKLTKLLTRSLSGIITVRDKKSQDTLSKISIQSNLIPDPAINMIKADVNTLDFDFNKRFVVITVKNKFTDVNETQKLISFLNEKNIVPVLVPMARHPYNTSEQDTAIIEKLRDARIYNTYDPRILEGVISKSMAVIGTRMHSIILATKNQVPAICIPYGQKHKFVLEQLGLQANFINKHCEMIPAIEKCL